MTNLRAEGTRILTELGGCHVATVHLPQDCRSTDERVQEAEDTARLLAASPKLYEFLCYFIRFKNPTLEELLRAQELIDSIGISTGEGKQYD